MNPSPAPAAKPTQLDWFFRVLGFLVMVIMAFALPGFPAVELDASWRMALGRFFTEGRQFGTDIVFTYGPLGWTMGKTYWGGQWAGLIGWHVGQALVFTAMIYWHGYRLQGYQRMFFFLFFFLFGLSYEDAAHQTIVAFAGLELIRRAHGPWRWSSLGLIALLVVLSLVKFTDLMLAVVLVGLAGALELWTSRRAFAVRVPALYLGLMLLGWKLCGQDLGNIPAYLRSSWEISQGYQDTMGTSCPPLQLVFGLTVAALVVTGLLLNLAAHPERGRGAVLTLATTGYLFVNWKHGFIRADGHQVGFYFAALTVIVTMPLLVGEAPRFRVGRNLLFAVAGLLTVIGLDLVLPGVSRGVLGGAQAELNRNFMFFLGRESTRGLYDTRLNAEKDALNLMRTRALVKQSTVDVLGYEQAAALVNDLNYQPRPVFQGYSAYTPYLSRLNYDYYASDRAPEFVLFKLQSIDYRLSTMDDPHVLRLLIQRYTYLFTELGYTVWQRKPGPFAAAAFEPKPLRTTTVRLGQKLDVTDLAGQHLWVEVDYRFSLLGKLRRFLFKPALVQLRITDDKGLESVHRLPQPIGRAGFMLNPVVEDLHDFMRAAGGNPKRRVRTIAIDTDPEDRVHVQDEITVAFSSLPPSDAGTTFFKEADRALFHMFMNSPVSYHALNPPNEETIDKRAVMIMHAPSEMIFDVPAGATELHGAYGFNQGAYSEGGRTNGAQFAIHWSAGGEPVILHERFLDPVNKVNDRGLQKFTVKLPKSTGQVYLRVSPGPYGQYAFDWTGWTAIEFK
jgi:hypothetical protein